MRLGRPRLCHHLHHGRQQGLSLARFRIRQGVSSQLRGQNGFESSSSVVCRAFTLVCPIGLHHAVDGGTDCARLPSNAYSMRSSRTFRRPAWLPVVRLFGPAFPDGRSKAREDFDPLIGLEPKEEDVVLVPDFARKHWSLRQLRSSWGRVSTVRIESWAAAAAASQRPQRLPPNAEQVENPVEFGEQNLV